MEAKVRKENLGAIGARCFPISWMVLDNSRANSTARIVLGWDPGILGVQLVFTSDQLLCVQVTCLETKQIFYVSVVYGANAVTEKRVLWDSMRSLFSSIGDFPWIQMGDFNVVCRRSERMGTFDVATASEFRQCLFAINMEELITRGAWFTWSNRRGGG